jgi:hypothetical protein
MWVFVFMVYFMMLSRSQTTHHWVLGCLMIWCGGLLTEKWSMKLFFFPYPFLIMNTIWSCVYSHFWKPNECSS